MKMKLTYFAFTVFILAGSLVCPSWAWSNDSVDDDFFVVDDDTMGGGDDAWFCDDDGLYDDGNCHDIIKPPTYCFSSEVRVRVEGKGDIKMSELELGDRVLVPACGHTKTTTINRHCDQYEEVFAFAHRDESKEATFLQISVDSKFEPLEITPLHLLFSLDPEGHSRPIPAGALNVGDTLLLGHNASPTNVTKITTVIRQGVYAPLTPSGLFLANNVVVSAYVTLQSGSKSHEVLLQNGWSTGLTHHQAAHIVLAPFQLFCTFFGSSTCHQQDATMPSYVSYSIQIAKAIDAYPTWLQLVLFVLFGFLASSLWVIKMLAEAASGGCFLFAFSMILRCSWISSPL